MKLRNYKRIAQIEDRKAAVLEKKYANAILKALKAQGENFIANSDIDNSLYPVIENLYISIFSEWLPRQWKQLENRTVKRNRFFLHTWNRWMQDYTITKLLTKVMRIDETTRGVLKDIVARGVSSGLSFEEISGMIRNKTSGRMGWKRAMTIARTEVGEAINAAKERSSEDWEAETGEKLGKIWIHRGAKDPRDWHMALDNGVVIPKENKWMVHDPNTGITDYMNTPHDPSASPGNVINCGCQVIYTRLDYK